MRKHPVALAQLLILRVLCNSLSFLDQLLPLAQQFQLAARQTAQGIGEARPGEPPVMPTWRWPGPGPVGQMKVWPKTAGDMASEKSNVLSVL
jgi:hypothetical protein